MLGTERLPHRLDVALYHHPKGDPREVFAYLAHTIPEERFERWELKSECLCGCEEITKALHGREDGARNYWRRGHHSRFVRQAGLPRPNGHTKRTASWREAVAKENADRLMTSMGVQMVVEEYLAEHKTTIRAMAKIIGCDESWLSGIRTGRLKRLDKKSAIRVLTALGETPHPDLFQRHDGSPRRV